MPVARTTTQPMADDGVPSSPELRISKSKVFASTNYTPHPGQAELHNSSARFRVLVTGRRFGKSLAAAKEAEAMLAHPNTRGWVVSKTYDLTKKVIREIYSDMVVKNGLKPVRSQMAGPILLEFPWGAVVEGKSAEHPESLLGEGLDWLIFDECAKCKRTAWEFSLRPTLTDREGWALFTTTPSGYNWIYDLYQRGNDPNFPEWESFRHPSWDNPYLSRDDIAEARRTLSESAFSQEYGADFTITTGQVYKEWDEDIHVVPFDQLYIDPMWPRYRAIDFGYENPFVCLYIAVDPDDRIIIYDEYYRRHRTNEKHAQYLNKDSTYYEYTVCDPSGASQRGTLLEHGIPTIARRSLVLPGLESVRQVLKARPDAKPGLCVSSKCVETIKEFNLYSYPEDRDSEEPAKKNDHGLDALRYFVVNWRSGYITQRIATYA